jgi:hypothetical protein
MKRARQKRTHPLDTLGEQAIAKMNKATGINPKVYRKVRRDKAQ